MTLRHILMSTLFLGFLISNPGSQSVLHAQVQGGITGTVIDPTGAMVPNANVTATNVETGQTRSTSTNSSGEFAISALVAGTYKVRVDVRGFKEAIETATVGVSQTSHLNIVLFLGTGHSNFGTIAVQVIDAHGAAVSGTVITIVAANGGTVASGPADQDGRFESTAQAGDYTIKAELGTSRKTEKVIHLNAEKTKKVKLTLR